VAILVALAAAGTAQGAPLVSLAPLRGDPEPALVRQLRSELCAAFECEPWHRVSTADSPDIAKARRRGVAGILTGFMAERRGRPVLSLSLLTRSRKPTMKWRLDLNRQGALDTRVMRLLIEDLETHLGGSAHAPPEPVDAPPPPRVTPPPPPEPLGIDLRPSRERAAAPPPPPPRENPVPLPPPPLGLARTPRPDAPAAPPAMPAAPAPGSPPAVAAGRRAAPERSPRWLAVELGLFAARRELRFQTAGLGAAQLREYSAPAITGPLLRLEVFPAAPFTQGLAAGAGLFGSYRLSVGLRTRTDAGEPRSSEISRLVLGATWRSPPLSTLRIVLAPSVSYQSLKAVVQPAIPGLADAKLSGVKGGLDLEFRSGRSLSFLMGGGYVKWTTAQDLVEGSVAFFPGGSASAIELEVGMSVAVLRWLSIRLLGEYSSTRYSFEADPTGVYSASGARDTYLGGRLVLRATD
jgi:hypothetical protein